MDTTPNFPITHNSLTRNDILPSYNIKRVNREIVKFWNIDQPYVDPLVQFNNKVRYITFMDNIVYFMLIKKKSNIINQNDDGNIVVSIEMQGSNYPFSPPKKILINGKNYFEYLRPNSDTYDILQHLIGKKCLCCSTLMCKNNWGPYKNLKDLLQEIIDNFELKQRIIEYIHARKIRSKFLIDDIPIFDYI